MKLPPYEIHALPKALEGNIVDLLQRVHGYLNRHVRSASTHKQGPWAYAGVSGGVFRTLRCKRGTCSNQKGWQYDAAFKDIPTELTQGKNLEVLAEVPYKPGRLVFFLAETLHDVTEVVAGSRRVLFMWFTCQPTLLNGVVENGHAGLVDYLISQGAEATEKFGVEAMEGKKPQLIHQAAAFDRSDLVRILVRHRAEAKATTTDGVQPIHLASAHSDVLETLLDFRAEISALNEAGKQPMHFAVGGRVNAIEHLVSYRAKVTAASKDGMQPMHIAARIGNVKAMYSLTNRRASVAVRDGFGAQPMHIAAYHGHLDVMKWLVTQNAPMADASANGETPLKLAISQGHRAVASQLRAMSLHSRQAVKHTDL